HPGGILALIPVMLRLMAEGRVNVVVLGHSFSEDILKKAGIPFKTMADFGWFNQVLKILLTAASFFRLEKASSKLRSWIFDVSVSSMERVLKAVSPDIV